MIYHAADQVIGGETFITTLIGVHKSNFVTNSATSCYVHEWDLYDSDVNENPTNTLLADSVNVKLQSTQNMLAIRTWFESYRKVVYLRNKNRNFSGTCNWQCYIDRYSHLTGKTWEEAKVYWLATG